MSKHLHLNNGYCRKRIIAKTKSSEFNKIFKLTRDGIESTITHKFRVFHVRKIKENVTPFKEKKKNVKNVY